MWTPMGKDESVVIHLLSCLILPRKLGSERARGTFGQPRAAPGRILTASLPHSF